MKPANPTLSSMMTLVPATVLDTINYANFTFRAEVDWVELHVRTQKPTNHWTVTPSMGVGYAKPLDEGPGGAATWFAIKIQNPGSWQAVQDKVDLFASKHPLAESPVVAAIEIAFDAYSKFDDHDDLVTLAAHFVKFSTLIGHENRRFATTGGASVRPDLTHHQDTLDHLRGDYSFYAGDHHPTRGRLVSSQAMRVYVKQTDAKHVLPVAERRARTERTLTMNGFEQRSLLRWKREDFTKFAEYFKFRQLKPFIPACARPGLESFPQVGEPCNRKRSNGGGVRRYRKSTVADTQLNRLAYEALRNLTDRMQYVSKIAKAREVAKNAGLRTS